jgi:hypothetical protein
MDWSGRRSSSVQQGESNGTRSTQLVASAENPKGAFSGSEAGFLPGRSQQLPAIFSSFPFYQDNKSGLEGVNQNEQH